MTVLILLLLVVPAFALTLYPLFRAKLQVPIASGRSARDEELADLHSRRDATYEALNDLKLEYQSGGLSERDYRDLEGKYKDRAFALMKRLDSATAPGGVEDEIEKQVLRLRKVKKESDASLIPETLACPSCKAEYQKGDRFCSRCGTKLTNP